MAERARIAVLGTGWWATQAHLPSLREYERAELVAAADPSPEKLAAAANAYGVERTYTDHRELLERERPDGVVIAVPHAFHYELARDALEAGISVLVEKPMTVRATHAHELVELAATRRVHLMVGYTWHFNPHAQALRDAIAGGRIGEIQFATSLFASKVIEFYRGHPERYRPMFNYPVTGPGERTYADVELGGGQGHTQITHSAALLFWLTGLVPEEVFAFMERFDEEVDLVDAIAVRFAGGAVGSVASTGNVGMEQPGKLEYRVYGTSGAVVADFENGTAAIESYGGDVERLPDVPPDEIYPERATARHLVDVILGDAENQAPGTLGALTVAFLDAAYRSAERRAPERVA